MALTPVDNAALENCDKEPIHIPGTIQQFGCLVAGDLKTELFNIASQNCADFLGKAASDLIGTSIETLLSQENTHTLRNVLGRSSTLHQREYVGAQVFGDQILDFSAHRFKDSFRLEFSKQAKNSVDGLQAMYGVINQLQSLTSFDDIFQLSVRTVREITQFDRVMFYRFLPDGAGEVVAEDRSPVADSFLGLRYPAWDIPKQARALYVKTPIRIIRDVQEEPVALLGDTSERAATFDMSLAILRGTSPVHLEYLSNMGIRSSMTLPIVVDNELWGLIACHDALPRTLGSEAMSVCELTGKVIGLAINQTVQQIVSRMQRETVEAGQRLVTVQEPQYPARDYGEVLLPDIDSVIENNGCALVYNDEHHASGVLCDIQVTDILVDYADQQTSEIVCLDNISERLSEHLPADIAGLLVIKISESPKIRLVFVRPAIQKAVYWAGRPDKDIKIDGHNVRLSPRKSFDKYLINSGHLSDEWTPYDLMFAKAIQRALKDGFDTSHKLSSQRENLGLMVHELNHRVRNILALVRSVAHQSRRSAEDIDDYVSGLEQRILALSNAHDLLTQDNMEGLSLRDIVMTELAPYVAADRLNDCVSIEGVHIGFQAAPMSVLLVHELVSNAVKYGALSCEGGRVQFSARIDADEVLLDWVETDGPPAIAPNARGFGLTLLEKSFPYEFGGSAELKFLESGFRAHYRLPKELFIASRTVLTSDPVSDAPTPKVDRKNRVLIVEDSYMLATEISSYFDDLGFETVDNAATVSNALRLLDEHEYDFCLLDINLRGEMSYPVAEHLVKNKVRFAFSSGYGKAKDFPARYNDIPMFKKPIRWEHVKAHFSQG